MKICETCRFLEFYKDSKVKKVKNYKRSILKENFLKVEKNQIFNSKCFDKIPFSKKCFTVIEIFLNV